MPLVYDELHSIAARGMRRERQGHTLSSTVLVNEAYLRLVDQAQVDWQDRRHFFGVAARLVRQILVDHARAKLAGKRGGGVLHLPIDEALDAGWRQDATLVDLDEALQALARLDTLQAEIVELRYFSGLTFEEAAGYLNLEVHDVKQEWAMAKAWLFRYLQPQGS